MNKTTVFVSMCMPVLLSGACVSEGGSQGDDAPLIGREEISVPGGLMTPEVLYSLPRVGGARISPDGKSVLYGVTFVSIESNGTNREIFVSPIEGSGEEGATQLTKTAASEGDAVWINGGKEIAFLSNEGGSSQVWIMNADGSGRRQVSREVNGVSGFLFAPDMTKAIIICDIKYGLRTSDIYPDLPKASGRIVDDLMYKHWDEWVESVPHPFLASFDGVEISGGVDIMEGEPYECPMKPFGSVQDLSWSPDSRLLAYACRKKTGKDYALSTNSDIYLYDTASGETTNLTEGMMGYDTAPAFSPDGARLAWISQERDGYESDKKRLFIADLTSGLKQYLTGDFDYDVDALQWAEDGRSLYFIACKEALTHIWQTDLEGKIRQVTSGQYDYVGMDVAGGRMIAVRQSMEYPSEVFAVDIESGEARPVSHENRAIFDQLTTGKSVARWITTTDGKQMLTWVIYPPHFDPGKKYPALLYCQGGPQSTVSQFWSYRWNMQIMAANGYIVVAPNRRGLPGFGQEWLEQISGDYGGQNMKDYLSAIDDVAREPYVDASRLGAVGASYGGFSVYWLAGNHQKRFKAFIAHAGIFNQEQQYLETEESWFANWDLGGPFWDTSNAVAQRSYANSPHRFVDRWDTPILITHGELDYRILASQGMSAFNAARLRDIPARMVVFSGENHWIAKPQNGVLFQRVFFDWLDKWLKPQ